MSMESSSKISKTKIHGGRYVRYSLPEVGIVFEFSQNYDLDGPLGRGAYGIVCSASNNETKEKVAIKKIAKAFDDEIIAKRTLREIMLLRHMDHENIIAIKDIIKPPQKDNFNDVYIVYEFMDTDLHKIISKKTTLKDKHFKWILYQLLRGLKYLHSSHVWHRDLKPDNLLISKKWDLKIADFGLARETSNADPLTGYVVTREYRAPELLLDCPKYDAAVDVWSVGCIFAEMMTLKPLFVGNNIVHQLRLITELVGSPDDSDLDFLENDNVRKKVDLGKYQKQDFATIFPDASPDAIDLLEKMLVFNPNKRITVDEALNHRYLEVYHSQNEEPTCPATFDYEFENTPLPVKKIKELIWNESVKFNPDP